LQQCATLNNLALLQERKGDLATAESTMREALALSEATGYRYGVAHASLALGRLCLRRTRRRIAQWLMPRSP
jgi:ATP/maltotriose-dependent transcriptional regulator MalT